VTRYEYGDDPAQFGELTLPAGTPRATVVIIHGGFWRSRYDLSLGRPLAVDLAARGYAAWNLEYRRMGNGGGWPATFDDIAAGIDVLADLPVDTSSVIGLGHSAGGHLAVWAAGRGAARVRLTGVVSQAGVLGLIDAAHRNLSDGAAQSLMGGSPADRADQYAAADPMAAIPLAVPVVCVHARADANVPFAQSAAYVSAAREAGADARLVEAGGDHFSVIDPGSSDWQLVVDALDSVVER
jgi:acetyl esterase/lipase